VRIPENYVSTAFISYNLHAHCILYFDQQIRRKTKSLYRKVSEA